MPLGASGPGLLQPRGDRRIEQAVAERFPGPNLGALAAALGNQPAHRRQRVDVLDDDPRVEHRFAAFHHQARHLAERIRLENVVAGPDIFELELVVELLFRHHDAHFAHVGAGE